LTPPGAVDSPGRVCDNFCCCGKAFLVLTGAEHATGSTTMQHQLAEARRYLEAGNLPQAERLYQQVLEADPQNTTALHELGVLALRAGRPAAAADYLRRAVALDGANASYQNHLGVALAGLQRFDEAIECLKRAVELDSRLGDVHYNLAKALGSAGRLEEAVAQYRAALETNPSNPEAHFNLGNTLRDLAGWTRQRPVTAMPSACGPAT